MKNNFKKALLLFIVAIWVNMLTEIYDNHYMFYHGNFHFSFTVCFIGRRALAHRSATSPTSCAHGFPQYSRQVSLSPLLCLSMGARRIFSRRVQTQRLVKG